MMDEENDRMDETSYNSAAGEASMLLNNTFVQDEDAHVPNRG